MERLYLGFSRAQKLTSKNQVPDGFGRRSVAVTILTFLYMVTTAQFAHAQKSGSKKSTGSDAVVTLPKVLVPGQKLALSVRDADLVPE